MAVERGSAPRRYAKGSAFGSWFVDTGIWSSHGVAVALDDLQRFLPAGPARPVILDAGCGRGGSLRQLAARFSPQRILGVDADARRPGWAGAAAEGLGCQVDLRAADASDTGLPDGSVDLVFCHQTLHHLADQEAALAESTRKYIRSWMIRLFFRHPMEVQRTAQECLALVRAAGFEVPEDAISLPFLWWSRWNLGALEWLGFPRPKAREETLVNCVARKPDLH
jgi:SAM-dependent methyltransferase